MPVAPSPVNPVVRLLNPYFQAADSDKRIIDWFKRYMK